MPDIEDPEAGAPLTAREQEIVTLVLEGLSNPAIAKRLCISIDTVKFHLRHIYRKLRARNRTMAIVNILTGRS